MQLNWNASSVRLVRCPIPTSYVYPVLPLSSILVLLQPVTQHRPLKVHLLSLQGLASLARIPPSRLVLQRPVNYIGSTMNHTCLSVLLVNSIQSSPSGSIFQIDSDSLRMNCFIHPE